jgi:hypothetical protein
MVNDKVEATVHPASPSGYVVWCEQCQDELFRVLFRDVAELLAERHEESRGHDTEVLEVDPSA